MAYPGFQRGGCLRSGPIRKVGGGGGGAVHFRSDIRKVGGGGGGPVRFRSDTFVWHTENIYMYLPTYYLGILHTRARMNMPAKVNLLQFFCHPYVRGGVRPPRAPLNPPLRSIFQGRRSRGAGIAPKISRWLSSPLRYIRLGINLTCLDRPGEKLIGLINIH